MFVISVFVKAYFYEVKHRISDVHIIQEDYLAHDVSIASLLEESKSKSNAHSLPITSTFLKYG